MYRRPSGNSRSSTGPHGGESRGVVDLIAVRKDHGKPIRGLNRGDAFEIVLIQVKGGDAPMPTVADGKRLRAVQRLHSARSVVLATWKEGNKATFYSLRSRRQTPGIGWEKDWKLATDLSTVFGPRLAG
jgi:hypothetical protein